MINGKIIYFHQAVNLKSSISDLWIEGKNHFPGGLVIGDTKTVLGENEESGIVVTRFAEECSLLKK